MSLNQGFWNSRTDCFCYFHCSQTLQALNFFSHSRLFLFSTISDIIRVASRVAKTLNLKKLGEEKEISRLGWDTLQKLIFSNCSQNCKSRYQSFLFLSSFAWFFYFWQNILSLTVEVGLIILSHLHQFPKEYRRQKLPCVELLQRETSYYKI